jgi:subtilisin family serine protease
VRLIALALLIPTLAAAAPGDAGPAPVLEGPAGEAPGTWFYADRSRQIARLVTRDGDLWLGGARVWRTGDVVVKVDDPTALARIERLPGVAWTEPLDAARGMHVAHAGYDVDEIALSTWIAGLPGVGFAHPDLEVELALHTLDDPLIGDAWHLDNSGQTEGIVGNDVGAFAAWTYATGAGQVISVLDTGLDPDHPDLRIVASFDTIAGTNPEPDPTYEGHGHGTAMAGVAGAIGGNGVGTAGIAPDADLIGVRMIGSGSALSSIYQGFVLSVENGATVLNNSWGFSAQRCEPFPPIGVFDEAVAVAENEGRGGLGTAVAMSYGNGGCDASGDGLHLNPLVISVGAASDLDRRIGYSNFGQTLDIMGYAGGDGRPGLVTTDIVGDGGYERGGDGAYWYGGSGTSSACASVSGVLALMFEANPRLTAAQARQVLCDTAVKPAWEDAVWDARGWSPRYGCGRIDAEAAIYAVWSELPAAIPEPVGDLVFGRARLRWRDEGDSGERLAYRVRLIPVESGDPVEFETQDPWLDLEGKVAPTRPYDWEVIAIDAWGDGRATPGERFVVEPAVEPEPVRACAAVAAPNGAWPLLVGPLALLVRSRRRR